MILEHSISISGSTTVYNLFSRYVFEELAPFEIDIEIEKNWNPSKYRAVIKGIVFDAISVEGIRSAKEILEYTKDRINFNQFISFI